MAGPMTFPSDGDKYWMPSLSYMRKSGQYTYGVGMLAQGGMGTEYGSSLSGTPAMPFRSEVGFGRLMFPLAINVNPNFIVAGQIDYVWAGMDVQMSPDGSNYVSFSNNNDFTGAATGNGWAFKLGAHYKVSDTFSVGATYHSKTNISDLEGEGTIAMSGGSPMPAKFKVIDFQWPETYGVGLAWQATPGFMLATDVKFIGWKNSMKDFRLSANVMGMGWNDFPPLPQNWKDQTVIMIGGQYMLSPGLALRFGYNHASNPVPDSTLNPLFPAIIESHYTLGLGWNIGGGHTVAGSIAIAPKVTRTNPNMFPDGSGGFLPGTTSHSQTTLRVNYNYSF
jgi:long-chain fatty acid transport protein